MRNTTLQKARDAALNLPFHLREVLIDDLIASVSSDMPVGPSWEEISERIQFLDDGKVVLLEARDVLREMPNW